jgi:uncharacterized protein YdeI (YjbR/CyaY-like superfamily)
LNTLDVRSCAQWRAWLAKHHESESEVWLVFHKRHTGRPPIDYNDALDEALCFGWIDSAKQQETKMRHLREAIDLLGDGKSLGLK